MAPEITSDQALHVDFYARGGMFGAQDRQREVLDRLDALERADKITGYDVHFWDGRVPLDAGEESTVVERYREFESWAERADAELDPSFTRREYTSVITDEPNRELILPVMCLAVSRGDSLQEVAPHQRGDETRTVDDCLDELEAHEPARRRVAVVAED